MDDIKAGSKATTGEAVPSPMPAAAKSITPSSGDPASSTPVVDPPVPSALMSKAPEPGPSALADQRSEPLEIEMKKKERRLATPSAIVAIIGAIILLSLVLSSPEFRERFLTKEAAIAISMVIVIGASLTSIIKYLGGDPAPALLEAMVQLATAGRITISDSMHGLISTTMRAASPKTKILHGTDRDSRVPDRSQYNITNLKLVVAADSDSDSVESKKKPEEEGVRALRASYALLRTRLHEEIGALTRRGNLNLAIGIVTTGVAALVLAVVAIKAPDKVADWREMLPQHILRISLAIFVEIFSFFFLRLYRSNLSDIKYFQNELTNVDMRIVAIEMSMLKRGYEEKEIAKQVVTALLSTERNFILKQGESTVDVERTRLEQQGAKEAVENLAALAKSIKG